MYINDHFVFNTDRTFTRIPQPLMELLKVFMETKDNLMNIQCIILYLTTVCLFMMMMMMNERSYTYR